MAGLLRSMTGGSALCARRHGFASARWRSPPRAACRACVCVAVTCSRHGLLRILMVDEDNCAMLGMHICLLQLQPDLPKVA